MHRALVLLATVACGAVALAAGQASAPGTPSSSLRTAWGAPNLAGVWTSGPMIDVPFERDAALGTRAVLTDAEFDKRVAAKRAQLEDDHTVVSTDRAPGMGFPGHWLERGKPSRQASLVVDPPDGRLPPQTELGARRARRWRDTADQPAGPEELNPYDRCITRGVLGSIFPNIYNSATRILQTPDAVTIHHEMIHETRVIPLDGRPHLSKNIRLYMGDPRGHWDGDTLVVETTNFNGQTGSFGRNGNGNPTSQSLRLVERISRPTADTLRYEVRIEDPETWLKPWTVAFPLTRDDSYRLYEYACHEGNYALPNILNGARRAEAAAAQGK